MLNIGTYVPLIIPLWLYTRHMMVWWYNSRWIGVHFNTQCAYFKIMHL